MKRHEPEQWIDVRRMPPGRRQVAYQQVAGRLPEDATVLANVCAEGVAAEAAQLALMLKFKGGQITPDATKVWPARVVDLDVSLDRHVGGLKDFIETMVRVFGGTPGGASWQKLAVATFPAGATYYTAQVYAEESARVATLLAELAKPEWAGLVAEGIMRDMIAALAAVHAEYASEVSKFEQLERVTWDEVKAQDLANHRRLCVFIAAIVHGYAGDATTRERLLAPIAQQDQAVYEALRDRRKVLDVDPTTGEPVAPVAPLPELT